MKKIKFTAVLASVILTTALIFSSSCDFSGSKIVVPQLAVETQYQYSEPTGYTPEQIKKAYGIDNTTATGKNKKIAVVSAYSYPDIESDLEKFDKKYNLPDANITVHNMGNPGENYKWALESCLDVEWVHAIAPSAQILLVNATTNSVSNLKAAIDYAVASKADIVTMSWGTAEKKSLKNYDSAFSNSNIIFVAAAGDDGAKTLWPAVSKNVISVGGTNLELSTSGNRISESAWSGSGGGTSLYEEAPSWQKTFNTGSSNKTVPDVSFDADPATGVAVYCSKDSVSPNITVKGEVTPFVNSSDENYGSGPWYKVGGTSFGSPAWAGIIADLNENSTYIKGAATLYSLAGSSKSYNKDNFFFDITSGSNGFNASSGYDEVTGLGSPNIGNFVGLTYSGHVQKIGWQNYVEGPTVAGTTGKALRMEGLKLKLNGALPSGGEIIYQAHVQKIGWQTAVKNGALAGTVGKSRRIEAMKITIKGLDGYKVQYRAHVQKKGWLPWQTVENGTDINKAKIAGTTGKALRMEAIEIKIVK